MEQFYSQEDGSGDSTVNLSTLSLFSGNEGFNKIPAEDSLSDHKQALLIAENFYSINAKLTDPIEKDYYQITNHTLTN